MSTRPQQAAAIPFRRSGTSVAVCLITAASSRGWGIPKGTIERGRSPSQTALQEAWEEAGLRGRIIGQTLGCYEYEKSGVLRTVAVYLMEVEAAADDWQEKDLRRRRWVAPNDAARILRFHPAASLVKDACALLESGLLAHNEDSNSFAQRPSFTALVAKVFNRLFGS